MKRLVILALIVFSLTQLSYALTPQQIVEKYGDAVVLIAGIKNKEEIGLGSGFIVKETGVIVTNYHVMKGAYPAVVKLKNGDIYKDISIIDYDDIRDIAIIKINGFDLPVVKLGNSNNVKVGEQLVVIGNPHGYENTVADGLLSQIRDTEKGYKLHQISVPISAGSSGSPVFNANGEVVGIATLSDVLGQNLNFSVPINYARGLISDKVKYSLKQFAGLSDKISTLSISVSDKESRIKTEEKITDSKLTAVQRYKKYHFYIEVTPAEEYKSKMLITSENDLLEIQKLGTKIKYYYIVRGNGEYFKPYDFAVRINDEEYIKAMKPNDNQGNVFIGPMIILGGFLVALVGGSQIYFDPDNYNYSTERSYDQTMTGQSNLTLGIGMIVVGALITEIESKSYYKIQEQKTDEHNLKYNINYFTKKMDVYNDKMRKDLNLKK